MRQTRSFQPLADFLVLLAMAFGKAGGSGILIRPGLEARQSTLSNVALSQGQELRAYYQTLLGAWGPRHWWPARTRFEVIVGAYLTQNTAWTNVERALRHLRTAGWLGVKGIRNASLSQLEAAIRSSGYFRQKARRLKLFVAFLDERYNGSLQRMFAQPTERLREELLALHGVGPETADSILLYAGQRPVFVVDAYTRRILERHNILAAKAPYEEIRRLFERALAGGDWKRLPSPNEDSRSPKSRIGKKRPRNAANAGHSPSPMSLARRSPQSQAFNEMHGLIVGVGKNYCWKSRPKCDECPLQKFLPAVK